jgi:hypothetical protein
VGTPGHYVQDDTIKEEFFSSLLRKAEKFERLV